MTFSSIWLILLTCWFVTYTSCTPLPFPKKGRRLWNSTKIRVQELYRQLSLDDIPTTVEDDVVLSNLTETRYGYLMGRPVTRILRHPVAKALKPVLDWMWSEIPPLLHWGILISKEPPYNITSESDLPRIGKKVPRPETGVIFELRNSANTGLIYLDVKNWTSYEYRQEKVKFEGTLNKSDDELITIGRAYIQHVGKEGFHDLYRNCQIFTDWYVKALWPKAPPTTRADQLLGKLAWWFKDWNKTFIWCAEKIKGWLGFRRDKAKAVDSSIEFVELERLLSSHSHKENETSA